MTRILSQADVEKIATMPMALEAVERAFRAMANGTAAMPPKVYLDVPEHHGDFRAMPAKMDQVAGLKWVNSHPRNPELRSLPSVLGLYVLSDPATGEPLAIMDGTLLTALRTGAAAGIASKALARSECRSLGLIGAGVQASQFLRAHREIYADLTVKVADVDSDRAERFAEAHQVRAVSTEESADSDIVCVATPSRAPVVMRDMIRAGTHINAMGADAPGKQELDPALLNTARVFVDEVDQATHSGEINVPLSTGSYSKGDLAGTLGDLLVGRVSGREDSSVITIFDSTGLAVQDLALAEQIFAAAGLHGIEVDFVGRSRAESI